jgi:hypothetical protein
MSAFEQGMSDLDECFRLVNNWQAEVRRLEGLNAAANRIIAEQAQTIAKMHAALTDIIDTNAEFRAQLPRDWEGDPLNDACESARAVLALVEQRK